MCVPFSQASAGALMCAAFFLCSQTVSLGAVSLPSIFSDHAVLQKSAKVPVWGQADPGENVKVSLDGATAEATADANGKWKTVLDLHDKGPGPYELVVQGTNQITLTDILVGEVWVCSGQSNMDFGLGGVLNAGEEIANSANPMLRQFAVGKNISATPLQGNSGQWAAASPATSASFSAVGYYFGKYLQKELKTPVGIVFAAWGGTPAQTWMSEEALDQDPTLKKQKEESKAITAAYPKQLKDYILSFYDWVQKYQRQDRLAASAQSFASPKASIEGWKPVQLPGLVSAGGLPDAGAIWLRKDIDIPAEYAGNGVQINLGKIHDFDTVYWDGAQIGKTSAKTNIASQYLANRVYSIPGSMVHAGKTTVAIRVYSPAGGAGITDGSISIGPTSYNGEWMAKAEYDLPPLSAEAKASYPKQPSQPFDAEKTATYLFNGMINPVIPYAIQGAIWYQGETNVGDAPLYHRAMTLLITDWRKKWGQGDFSFYLCQLANFMGPPTVPGDSAWAELREAQATLQNIPNTGSAVLIDIGEEGNIHPRNKKDAGERLALNALAKTYGRAIPYSGPVYSSMKVEGNKVRLTFTNIDGGLVAKPLSDTYQPDSASPATKPLVRNSPDSELEGFSIRDANGKWSWAEAKIDKDTVLVWARGVSRPVEVRYAWADNPICNLYNKAGLPAVPFRTDNPFVAAH